MLSFTSGELNGWIVAFFFPLTRILALLVLAPPFNNAALSPRVRVTLGVAIALAITPALPPMPNIDPASGLGLWIMAQQMLIGFAMGFAMRLVFSAIDMAGNLISAQMGLGFATFYDPMSSAQTPVISEVLGMLALMLLMASNGHLMILATLTYSFTALPISLTALGSAPWLSLAESGGKVFYSGLLLALPIIVALLITNIALSVLSRAAPQLNLFAIGFGVTLAIGFGLLIIGMSYLAEPLQKLFELGLQAMLGHFPSSANTAATTALAH
ncbi:MAG: flagellar biosynthetic protein FliR [Pseudomonadota bacterium]